MRSKSNGTIAALFMLVPLVTVVVLAVFGIPQFVSVVASPVESPRIQFDDSEVGVGESLGHRVDDLFADFDGDSNEDFQNLQATDAPVHQDWDDPFHDTEVIARERNHRRPSRRTRVTDNTGNAAAVSASADDRALDGWRRDSATANNRDVDQDSGRKPLTWKVAIAKLREVGIREYRLEPAERPNEFHFSCSYTPADNPRITHLFEAEAAEPLRAVEKVLEQIAEWSRKR